MTAPQLLEAVVVNEYECNGMPPVDLRHAAIYVIYCPSPLRLILRVTDLEGEESWSKPTRSAKLLASWWSSVTGMQMTSALSERLDELKGGRI